MNELLQITEPWWHYVLRAAVVFIGVLVLMRMSGKRALGQFTPFDLIMLILIGNAVQNGMNGGDNSLTVALILSVTLVVLNWLLAYATANYAKAEDFIEGKSVVVALDGQVFHQVLRDELISKRDFKESMRENDIQDIDQIKVARLETNGKLTFEKR